MSLTKRFDQSWIDAIGEDVLMKLLIDINAELSEQRKTEVVLPPAGDPLLFKAFRLTKFNDVRCIIVGMDPYHDSSYNGVAFGNGTPTMPSTRISPSLKNILKEVERSYGTKPSPDLYSWAEQGVLLINTAHSVIKGDAGSHLHIWASFTKEIFKIINKRDNIVWMLWGNEAAKYDKYITNDTHKIIKAGHPSPLNRANPLFGSDCFMKCDKVIKGDPILWSSPF